MASVSVATAIEYLCNKYGTKYYHEKVSKMHPNQILAIYYNCIKRDEENKKLEMELNTFTRNDSTVVKVKETHQEKKEEPKYHQIDMFEYMAINKYSRKKKKSEVKLDLDTDNSNKENKNPFGPEYVINKQLSIEDLI